MKALKKNIVGRAAVLAAAVVMVSLLAAGAASARSTSSSYIYTQPGHVSAIAICVSACGRIGQVIYPANGTPTWMYCWYDGTSLYGNYWSPRYFWVWINGRSGLWQVHSSYVYYQTAVPHC